MSDNLKTVPVEDVEVAAVPEGNGVVPEGNGVAADLSREVKNLLAASSQEVRTKVRDHLVQKTISERADLVLKGLDKRGQVFRDLQKVRPDQKSVSADGKKEERFSEAKWKEKKDLEDKLTKLDKALELALSDKADYEALKKVVN